MKFENVTKRKMINKKIKYPKTKYKVKQTVKNIIKLNISQNDAGLTNIKMKPKVE